MLLDLGVNPVTSNGSTVAHSFAEQAAVDRLREWLRRPGSGALADTPNEASTTPLHVATATPFAWR